jgi:hypothetical protein
MHANSHAVFSAVLQMVGLSEAAQSEHAEGHKKHMSPLAWAKEFCTVRIGGPRGCGHTAAAVELFRYFQGRCVCILPNESMAGRFFRRIAEEGVRFACDNPRSMCISIQNKSACFGLGSGMEDLDAVIVDPASFVSEKKLDENVYAHFMYHAQRQERFFFIFLE